MSSEDVLARYPSFARRMKEANEELQQRRAARLRSTPTLPLPTPLTQANLAAAYSSPPPPPPQPLGFSPITAIDIPPSPPQALGLSQITCADTAPEEPAPDALSFNYFVLLSEEPVSEGAAPKTSTPSEARAVPVKSETRKRKGKKTREKPYAIKRRLDDAEAKKIATAPPVADNITTDTVPSSAKTSSPKPDTPNPNPEPPKTSEVPKTPPTKMTTPSKIPTGKNHKHPTQPANPDATTSKYGVVVHGIALRKDLGRIRRWLEEGNPELGKTIGIRWLRKKTLLLEEGKKTSSVVVYLEGGASAEKVRLDGKWLRISTYEPDRRRK